MHDNWIRYIDRYSKILEAGYDLASEFEHNGLSGEVREYFVDTFLKKIIPESMGIGSGKVVDRSGSLSQQIDLIIYEKKFPILTFTESRKVYPIESVVATIEVKSTLSGDNLKAAFDNCKSITDLHPTVEQNQLTEAQIKMGDEAVEWVYPATYIFAYKHYKENAALFRDAVISWHNESLQQHNITFSAIKPSLNLLYFPRMTVTEGCIAVRSSNTLSIRSASTNNRILFAAKKTDYRIHTFVCDLLSKIIERSSFSHPKAPGCVYGMESYFDTRELLEKTFKEEGEWQMIETIPVP